MTGKTIFKWIIGIFFLLGGVVGIFQTPLVGLISILIGLFILPATYKLLIEQKANLKLTSPIKWIITIVGVVIMGMAVSSSKESKDKEVDVIVENASKKIDEGKIDESLKLIKEAKSKYSTSDNNATKLEKEIEKAKDIEFAKQTLAKMTDEEFNQLKANSLKKEYLTQKTLNKNFIELLNSKSAERAKIIAEVKLQEEIAKQEELNKNRKELIEKQFSAYDGSHRGLERYIKEHMNDPDTYDHMETRFLDNGDYILVFTKFRGANAFGGKVINTVSAKVDLEGNVIEIVSQN
jgi:hypothetical protein